MARFAKMVGTTTATITDGDHAARDRRYDGDADTAV
jgi:hypothetical protein